MVSSASNVCLCLYVSSKWMNLGTTGGPSMTDIDKLIRCSCIQSQLAGKTKTGRPLVYFGKEAPQSYIQYLQWDRTLPPTTMNQSSPTLPYYNMKTRSDWRESIETAFPRPNHLFEGIEEMHSSFFLLSKSGSICLLAPCGQCTTWWLHRTICYGKSSRSNCPLFFGLPLPTWAMQLHSLLLCS